MKQNNAFTLAEVLTGRGTLQPVVAKAGFSLAEVLITLGIIGIVAAMTIPNLITKLTNDKNSAILKEDYSILQNVLRKAYDDGAIAELTRPDNREDIINLFENHFLTNMKVASTCYNKPGCWSADIKTLNGQTNSNFNASNCGPGSISFTMNNGSTVCINDYYGSYSNTFGVEMNSYLNLVFYIDTNGIQNKPNTIGKDIFIVVFDSEKGVFLPAGHNKSQEDVNNNCKKSGTGYWCMEYIKNNGFKIPIIK